MSGIIITGSDNVITEGSQQARLYDIGVGFCGHSTVIVTGSPTVVVNGRAAARVGDAVAGFITGIIVTGAETVYADGE